MKEYVIMDTEFNSTSNRAIQISAVRITRRKAILRRRLSWQELI
jgi:hypothetical protein